MAQVQQSNPKLPKGAQVLEFKPRRELTPAGERLVSALIVAGVFFATYYLFPILAAACEFAIARGWK